jgi:methylenetetrahydrofolate reductase (NADPH)
MEENLWQAITRLAPLDPAFVSVTYGAGGSTRERTHRTVKRILDETSLKPAAHLTCVGASRAEVDEVIREYWETGVRHIVSLRGDPPPGEGGIGGVYVPRADGYANATELTKALRAIAPFEVLVGVYPEKHPESPSIEHDIDVLKQKVDAGATLGISQFFFDHRRLPALRRQGPRRRDHHPDRAGHHAGDQLQGPEEDAAACGTAIPAGWPICSTAWTTTPRPAA